VTAAAAEGAGAPFVEVNQVSLSYGDDRGGTLALQDASLTIRHGELAAVVGPSGCGKSSLLKLVSGLALPSRGEVRVGGARVERPLTFVGMAFQNPTLLPWRTTLRNVLLPLEVARAHRRAYRKDPAPYVAAAHELLAAVGLAGFEDRYPWQLSGGMQQRASLCRALIHEPDLLLLDEPFAALDAFTREDLWGVLQELRRKRRFTCILVTHDLREAVFLADTVHVSGSRPGRIIFQRAVDLPRPRRLEDCYTPAFVDHVHQLRNQIRDGRAA
jgi:NitT/TauT family transport system ATP-binding protein